MDRKPNAAACFTQSDRFIFCDLCRNAAGLLDFADAKPLASVTFANSGREGSAIGGREIQMIHHDAEHRREGAV